MGAVVPGGWRRGPLPKLASEGWWGHGEFLLSWSALPLPIRASQLSVLAHDSEVDCRHPPSSSPDYSAECSVAGLRQHLGDGLIATHGRPARPRPKD